MKCTAGRLYPTTFICKARNPSQDCTFCNGSCNRWLAAFLHTQSSRSKDVSADLLLVLAKQVKGYIQSSRSGGKAFKHDMICSYCNCKNTIVPLDCLLVLSGSLCCSQRTMAETFPTPCGMGFSWRTLG